MSSGRESDQQGEAATDEYRILLDFPDLQALISEDAVDGLLQAVIAANRLLAAIHLMWLNAQYVERSSATAHIRNKSALFALAVTSQQEAAEAVRLLGNQGVPERLNWAKEQWEELRGMAERWADKRAPFRNLRNWLGAHINRDKIRHARQRASSRIVFLRGTDARPATAYYEGPDDLLFQGWVATRSGKQARETSGAKPTVEASLTDTETFEILSQVEDDNLRFVELLEYVVCDLMGADVPVDSETVRDTKDSSPCHKE